MFFCKCKNEREDFQEHRNRTHSRFEESPIATTISYSSGPRLSQLLPSNEPLELIAQANEAICDRNALLACKKLSELCLEKDLATNWLKEQIAQCLARAFLLLGDVFPMNSRFPPVDTFFAGLMPDDQAMVAVVCHDIFRNAVLPQRNDDGFVDGIESYPVTFFQAQPPVSLNRDGHVEFVMLFESVSIGTGTYHLQDTLSLPNIHMSTSSIRRSSKTGKTYYCRKVLENVLVIVCFPRSLKDAGDPFVEKLLDRMARLFVF